MTPPNQQLLLDLSLRPALGRDDFLVADSNAAAVALVDQWPKWPSYATLIVGPAGSGKSHLIEVWQQVSGAQKIPAIHLNLETVPVVLASGALAIEDADQESLPEIALFHTMNLARQQNQHLLFSARSRPENWPISLPDLASRLRAMPSVEILAPDDALLRGVLVKHFMDRQIAVDEALIAYLVLRMPRSLDAARSLAKAIDDRAMLERAEITRPFAAKVLADFLAPDMLL